ncbi:hypothetical protein [Nostoc sp. FACHB-110]|nr:hypothetical protein [Nostoc sp. FACHB-110]MBD2439198.1 hypothetical protein [Nostoc sp. FACHB-110]
MRKSYPCAIPERLVIFLVSKNVTIPDFDYSSVTVETSKSYRAIAPKVLS